MTAGRYVGGLVQRTDQYDPSRPVPMAPLAPPKPVGYAYIQWVGTRINRVVVGTEGAAWWCAKIMPDIVLTWGWAVTVWYDNGQRCTFRRRAHA